MSEQTETMLKNIREGMAMDGQAPHALTREQVERMKRDGFVPDIHRVLDSHETLRQALAQQAQEVERLKEEASDQKAKQASCVAELAAMTAERDAAIRERDAYKAEMILMAAHQGIDNYQRLLDQLAASQARVRELEAIINKADYRRIMDPPDGGDPTLTEKAQYLVDRISHANTQLAILQATLAAREAEIERMKNILTYIADCQPDGKKYLDEAQALSADYCEEQRQERDTARQDAARLREALEAVLPIAVEWCSPEEATEMAAIEQAQRALKGA